MEIPQAEFTILGPSNVEIPMVKTSLFPLQWVFPRHMVKCKVTALIETHVREYSQNFKVVESVWFLIY